MTNPRLYPAVLLLSACLIPETQARTVFTPNCTGPTNKENFVKEPDIRGTMHIIWSSLFTIIACTWTLQHPNVPKQYRGLKPWTKSWWGAQSHSLFENAKWMVITVLAPEVIIIAATHDLLLARQLRKKFHDKAQEGGVTWGLRHSYYALMGGFVLDTKELDVIREENTNLSDMPRIFHLSGEALEDLRNKNYISHLPDIEHEEINNLCEHDMFVKVVALCQIIWSSSQAIVRARRGLDVSPLEVSVLAFAACGVIIYGLYWCKPQGVRSTTTVKLSGTGKASFGDIHDKLWKMHQKRFSILRILLLGNMRSPLLGHPIGLDELIVDAEFSGFGGGSIVAGIVGATLFGAVHIGAWNFPFPSLTDQLVWRIATVYTIAFGVLATFLDVIGGLIVDHTHKDRPYSGMLLRRLIMAMSWSYVLCRVAVLVEIVRTLFFLPPNAYTSTWTSNFPHFG
ncbi:hypothetical protein QBC44DRAFT_368995 [Cladorrhinum sp. PSN332]|nr:hypothetical protein QBC44DRAFT_368995 [Cladorrhinum sp. PSN332]